MDNKELVIIAGPRFSLMEDGSYRKIIEMQYNDKTIEIINTALSKEEYDALDVKNIKRCYSPFPGSVFPL